MLVRIIGRDMRVLDHRVWSVGHVVPHGVRSSSIGLVVAADGGVVRFDHGKLILGDTQSMPEKFLMADKKLVDQRRKQGGPDTAVPDPTLFIERSRFKKSLDEALQTEDKRDPPLCAECMLRASSVIRSAATPAGKDLRVGKPVLERAARQVRR